jgi:hypothetical protein
MMWLRVMGGEKRLIQSAWGSRIRVIRARHCHDPSGGNITLDRAADGARVPGHTGHDGTTAFIP